MPRSLLEITDVTTEDVTEFAVAWSEQPEVFADHLVEINEQLDSLFSEMVTEVVHPESGEVFGRTDLVPNGGTSLEWQHRLVRFSAAIRQAAKLHTSVFEIFKNQSTKLPVCVKPDLFDDLAGVLSGVDDYGLNLSMSQRLQRVLRVFRKESDRIIAELPFAIRATNGLSASDQRAAVAASETSTTETREGTGKAIAR